MKSCFLTQLQGLTQKLEALPKESFSMQNNMARRQLEYDVGRVKDTMQHRLGTYKEIAARYEARIKRLRKIDKEIVQLQTRQDQLERILQDDLQESKRDSGSCDHYDTNANTESQQNEGTSANDGNNNDDSNTGGDNNGFNTSRYPCDSGILPDVDNTEDTSTKSRMVTTSTQTMDDFMDPYMHLTGDNAYPRQGQHNMGVPLNPEMYHGTWSFLPAANSQQSRHSAKLNADMDTSSVMSFNSSAGSGSTPNHMMGSKVEMVYSLLSMLGTHDKDDVSRTLLAMSSSQDSCIALRQSGCLPLLINLLHGPEDSLMGDPRASKEARSRAGAALHNVVHSHPDEKKKKEEAKVLRLLEQIRSYCDFLRDSNERPSSSTDDPTSPVFDHNPAPAVATLMKLSFDEEHRSAICQLGGLLSIAELLQLDYDLNSQSPDQYCLLLRRYAGMTLTNLTFGDGANKATLCSMKGCMRALVAQLTADNEDLTQVAASVLRNLSWRADIASKRVLREVGSVVALMNAALVVKKEPTLKSVLSALWNLSAHCTENKADICAVEGALKFLVSTLTYKSPSRTWAVVENGGGILRNVSSHIATSDVYRNILRVHNCLQILLKQLKSSSLTIVSNACGTLWNLSARCKDDQDLLWKLGAVNMLKNLVHSKHKMIAMGSSAALKNLMAAKPDMSSHDGSKDSTPTLHIRKQKALVEEIDKNLRDAFSSMNKPYDKSDNGRKSSRGRLVYPRNQSHSVHHTDSGTKGPVWFPRDPNKLETKRNHSPLESGSSDSDNHHVQQSPGSSKHDRSEYETDDSGKDSSKGRRDRKQEGSKLERMMLEVAMNAGIKIENEETNNTRQIEKDQASMRPSSVTKIQQQNGSNLTSRSNSFCFGFDANGQNFHARRLSNDSINSIASDVYPMGTHGSPYGRHHIDHQMAYNTGYQNEAHSMLAENHAAMIRKVTDDCLEQDRDTIINFSQKYSDESLGGRTAKDSKDKETARNQIPNIPPDLARKYQLPFHQPKEDERRMFNMGHNSGNPSRATGNQIYSQRFNYPTGYNLNQSSNGQSEDKPSSNVELIRARPNPKMTTFLGSKLPSQMREPAISGARQVHYDDDEHEEFSATDQPTDYSRRYATDMDESTSPGVNFIQMPFTSGTNSSIYMVAEDTPDVLNVGNQNNDKCSDDDKRNTQSNGKEIFKDDKKKFCVEDTPTVYSMRSSLSSLNFDEPDHVQQRESYTPPLEHEQHNDLQQDEDNESRMLNNHTKYEKDEREVHFVEETPLVFSRASSTSSLSSFDMPSICEDRSSIFSDSRRASEVVSPSDLPDSPSQSMPSSPKRNKSAFLKKKADICEQKVINTVSKAPPPPELSYKPTTFATEGTPMDFSCSTSLSGLSIEGEEKIKKDIDLPRVWSEEPNDHETESQITTDDTQITEDEVAEMSEREQNLLDACIKSAIPAKKSTTRQTKGKSKTANKGKDSLAKNNFSLVQEELPAKDVKQSYCTEDTPLMLSTRTSLSDLTIDDFEISTTTGGQLVMKDVKKDDKLDHQTEENFKNGESQLNAGKEEGASEPNSFLNDTDDSILEACINSAIPPPKPSKFRHSGSKGKSSRLGAKSRNMGRPSGIPRRRNTPPDNRHRNHSPIPEVESENKTTGNERVQAWCKFQPDELLHFRTEKTPSTYSAGSGLSKLTIDSALQEDVINGNVELNTIPQVPLKSATSKTFLSTAIAQRKPVYGASPGASPLDSPRVFGIEGTPISFSRNDSLSSLSCEEDVDFSEAKRNLSVEKAIKGKSSSNSTVAEQNSSQNENTNMLMVKKTVDQLNTNEKKSANVDTSFRQSRVNSADSCKKFYEEGTPFCFSRNSSLSSLSDLDECTDTCENEQPQQNYPTSGKDTPHMFAMEGTPVCFSRNSSLSSLSMDEETEAEQALLDACINSAIPPPKITKKPVSKAPKPRISTLSQNQKSNSVSGISATQQLMEKKSESSTTQAKGPRIVKPSETQKQPETKSVVGGKKTYKSPITGKSRSITLPRSTTPPKPVTPTKGAQKNTAQKSPANRTASSPKLPTSKSHMTKSASGGFEAKSNTNKVSKPGLNKTNSAKTLIVTKSPRTAPVSRTSSAPPSRTASAPGSRSQSPSTNKQAANKRSISQSPARDLGRNTSPKTRNDSSGRRASIESNSSTSSNTSGFKSRTTGTPPKDNKTNAPKKAPGKPLSKPSPAKTTTGSPKLGRAGTAGAGVKKKTATVSKTSKSPPKETTLDVPRPTLVKQSTFTKDSASIPESTPVNTTIVTTTALGKPRQESKLVKGRPQTLNTAKKTTILKNKPPNPNLTEKSKKSLSNTPPLLKRSATNESNDVKCDIKRQSVFERELEELLGAAGTQLCSEVGSRLTFVVRKGPPHANAKDISESESEEKQSNSAHQKSPRQFEFHETRNCLKSDKLSGQEKSDETTSQGKSDESSSQGKNDNNITIEIHQKSVDSDTYVTSDSASICSRASEITLTRRPLPERSLSTPEPGSYGPWMKRNDSDLTSPTSSKASSFTSRQNSSYSLHAISECGDALNWKHRLNSQSTLGNRMETWSRQSTPQAGRKNMIVNKKSQSVNSLSGVELEKKEKKRFSFLKFKFRSKKSLEDEDEKEKSSKEQKSKDPKKKKDDKSKDKSKYTEKSKSTENFERSSERSSKRSSFRDKFSPRLKKKGKKEKDNDKDKILKDKEVEMDVKEDQQKVNDQSENDVFRYPDNTLDRRLGLDRWNSDNNIDNEVMPYYTDEWDSDNDINNETMPDLPESCSDMDHSPDDPPYQITITCNGYGAKSTKDKKTKVAETIGEKQRTRNSSFVDEEDTTLNSSKNSRRRTLSADGPSQSGSQNGSPRPQKLQLPHKPFGMNRSEDSPATVTSALVSPYNYSPYKRSSGQRADMTRLIQDIKQLHLTKDDLMKLGGEEGDNELVSPSSSSTITTV
ncbi:adenomatous polyposis coli protein-like isoform X2 [Antedon mediterranea]